jgi:DNA-binding NarL/FixJ family response regulator
MEPLPPVLIVCTDLIFSTKITGTAKALGRPYAVARTQARLQEHLAATPPSLVIVDMAATGVDPLEAIRTAKAAQIRVIAFLSHVEADTALAARDAGADAIMARSAFSAKLPELLAS